MFVTETWLKPPGDETDLFELKHPDVSCNLTLGKLVGLSCSSKILWRSESLSHNLTMTFELCTLKLNHFYMFVTFLYFYCSPSSKKKQKPTGSVIKNSSSSLHSSIRTTYSLTPIWNDLSLFLRTVGTHTFRSLSEIPIVCNVYPDRSFSHFTMFLHVPSIASRACAWLWCLSQANSRKNSVILLCANKWMTVYIWIWGQGLIFGYWQ